MKLRLLLLIFIFLMPVVSAELESSKVFVVNFNYDNGLVTYKDKVIKSGYFPDRKIQPEEGYRAEVISIDNIPLYSFRFNIPLKLNVDVSNPVTKNLSGGIVMLNETDFALIFPYYDEAKSIVVYNPREYQVLTVPLIEEQFFMEEKSFWWVLLLVVVALIAIYAIYKHYKKR